MQAGSEMSVQNVDDSTAWQHVPKSASLSSLNIVCLSR